MFQKIFGADLGFMCKNYTSKLFIFINYTIVFNLG